MCCKLDLHYPPMAHVQGWFQPMWPLKGYGYMGSGVSLLENSSSLKECPWKGLWCPVLFLFLNFLSGHQTHATHSLPGTRIVLVSGLLATTGAWIEISATRNHKEPSLFFKVSSPSYFVTESWSLWPTWLEVWTLPDSKGQENHGGRIELFRCRRMKGCRAQGNESAVHSGWTQSRVQKCDPCKDARLRRDRCTTGMRARWLAVCSLSPHRQGFHLHGVCSDENEQLYMWWLQNLLFQPSLRVKQHRTGTILPRKFRLWSPEFCVWLFPSFPPENFTSAQNTVSAP